MSTKPQRGRRTANHGFPPASCDPAEAFLGLEPCHRPTNADRYARTYVSFHSTATVRSIPVRTDERLRFQYDRPRLKTHFEWVLRRIFWPFGERGPPLT